MHFTILSLLPFFLAAQIDPVSDAIKSNVAAISSQFASGALEQGFGFVVGEYNGLLYLVTAGHVVQEEGAEPGKENAVQIRLRFCSEDRDYSARILQAGIHPYDVALLELTKPMGYTWYPNCLSVRPKVGQSIGYIGRNNTCYVPTTTARGTVNQISLDRISVDIIGIGRGTSGAPLLGKDGLVGMIINADQAWVEALTMDRLREEITQREHFPFRFGIKEGEFHQNQENANSNQDIIQNKMAKIDGGTYTMGCVENRDGPCKYDNELPAHSVTISGFYLSKYEVSNDDFEQFLNAITSELILDANGVEVFYQGRFIFFNEQMEYSSGDSSGRSFSVIPGYEKYPVVGVSKYGAVAYCNWLTNKTGKAYRLPTEAEWEFAARGGTLSKGFKYAGSNNLDEVGWYDDGLGTTIHPVGHKKANELGLFDMCGNVWEWCADWYDAKYYAKCPNTNPQGPSSDFDDISVLRGGSWTTPKNNSYVAKRNYGSPGVHGNYFGFRVARDF